MKSGGLEEISPPHLMMVNKDIFFISNLLSYKEILTDEKGEGKKIPLLPDLKSRFTAYRTKLVHESCSSSGISLFMVFMIHAIFLPRFLIV